MDAPLYAVEREFDVPVERLWRAWTDAAELEQWYHPVDLFLVPGSVVSQPVVGGAWAVGVDVPQYGFVAWLHGRCTVADEPRRFVPTLFCTQDRGEFEARDEAPLTPVPVGDLSLRVR